MRRTETSSPLLDRVLAPRTIADPVVEVAGEGLTLAALRDRVEDLAFRLSAAVDTGTVVVCGDRNDELLLGCLAVRWLGLTSAIAGSDAAALGRLGLLAGETRLRLNETLFIAPAAAPPEAERGDGFLLLTSGSTGAPRWAMRLDASLIEEGERYRRFFGLTAGEAVAAPLSMSHAFTLGLALGLLACGARLHTWPSFSPRTAARAIAADTVALTALVPAAARLVCSAAESMGLRARISGRIVVGAGPVEADLDDRLRRLFGCSACRNYGSSETGAVLGSLGETAPEGATGYPLPGVETRLVETPDGAVLHVRTSVPFAGHLTGTGGERGPASADGWVDMGDFCRPAGAGWLAVTGRRGIAIRRGGKIIDPAEIERAVGHHPAVADCAVVGAAGDGPEEEIEAHLATRPGHAPTEAGLRAFLAAALPLHMVPTHFVFHRELPRGPGGKIDRARLRAWGGARGRVALARAALDAIDRLAPGQRRWQAPDAALGLDLISALAKIGDAGGGAFTDPTRPDVTTYERWLAGKALGPGAFLARLQGGVLPAMDATTSAAYVRLMARPALLAARALARRPGPPPGRVVEIGLPAGSFAAILGRAWPETAVAVHDPGDAGNAPPPELADLLILHNTVRRSTIAGWSPADFVHAWLRPGGTLVMSDIFPTPGGVEPEVLAALRLEWWSLGLSPVATVDEALDRLGLRDQVANASLKLIEYPFALSIIEMTP